MYSIISFRHSVSPPIWLPFRGVGTRDERLRTSGWEATETVAVMQIICTKNTFLVTLHAQISLLGDPGCVSRVARNGATKRASAMTRLSTVLENSRFLVPPLQRLMSKVIIESHNNTAELICKSRVT